MDTLKQVLELLLLLVIVLAILLLFGPAVVVIAIVGKIKWRGDNILDIGHMGRLSRIAFGAVGFVTWIVIYGLLLHMLVPTPVVASILAPAKIPIDQMDTTFGWQTFQDAKGSVVSIRSVPGIRNNAIEIGYDLKPEGWVAIVKEITPSILVGTSRIRFSYAGYGASNTMQLKLIYGEGVVFSIEWVGVTDTNGKWRVLEASYNQFTCWEGTGCTRSETIDVRRVEKIDFAIVNSPGNTPGIGVVRIDNVEARR